MGQIRGYLGQRRNSFRVLRLEGDALVRGGIQDDLKTDEADATDSPVVKQNVFWRAGMDGGVRAGSVERPASPQ